MNITKCPFFEEKDSLTSAQQQIRDLFNDLNQYSARHISHTFLLYESPDGGNYNTTKICIL